MKHVRLALDGQGREAEIHPMYDLLANAPFVDQAKTTHWNYSEGILGIMHYVHGDVEQFEARVDRIDDINEYDLTPVNEGTFYAYLRCVVTDEAAAMFGAFTQGHLVVNHPIEWTSEGTQVLSVVGSGEEIQTAISRLPASVDVTVREIGGIQNAAEAAEALLTDRQADAVDRALALGYYEIPREADLEAVADELGCSRSTAAEHLRKAEAKLFNSVFDG